MFVVWLRFFSIFFLFSFFLFSLFVVFDILKPIFLLPFQFAMDHLFSGFFLKQRKLNRFAEKSNIEKKRIKNNNKKNETRDNKNLYIIAAHHNAAASELCKCICNNIASCVFRVCDLDQIFSPFQPWNLSCFYILEL